MALGRSAHAFHVSGTDLDGQTVAEAVARGVVDTATTSVADAVKGADVIVFATPVTAIPALVRAHARHFKPGAVVTDVGSTKATLCETLPALLPRHVHYVGGHPLAGSERSKLQAADGQLFEHAVYVLTPPARSGGTERLHGEAEALQRVKTVVRAVGALPVVMDARRHDDIVAAVSHLPHVIAAALVGAVANAAAADDDVFALAAGGFHDTTRIAGADAALWRDICLDNREPLLRVLDEFDTTLQKARDALVAGDARRLHDFFAAARTWRAQLPSRGKGVLPPVCELVVHVADEPGALHRVTGCVADAGVNIKDIEVLREPGAAGGTVRLGFATEAQLQLALERFVSAGFRAERRG